MTSIEHCNSYNPAVDIFSIQLACDGYVGKPCYAENENMEIYGLLNLTDFYFENENSTDISVQVTVEFMHSKITLYLDDFCDDDGTFEPVYENATCMDSGEYSFVIEDFQFPSENTESAVNWLRLGMRATLSFEFWEKNFKGLTMGCAQVELGSTENTSSKSQRDGLTEEEMITIGAVVLGLLFSCGMLTLYWSGRAARAEKEELRRARLMGEVVDWGVRIE